MNDALDRRLHALLDGRLSAEERRDLEAQLRDDPQLAARLATYRGIGDALRADDAPLPPGFHARARARFQAGRESRRWFRPVSWENMGLAAAAMLALAVFVPQWLDGKGPIETVAPQVGGSAVDAVESEIDPSGHAPNSGARAEGAPVPRRDDADAARQDLGRAKPAREQQSAPATAPAEPESRLAETAETFNDAPSSTPDDRAPRADEFAQPKRVSAKSMPFAGAKPDTDRDSELLRLRVLADTAEPFTADALRFPLVGPGDVQWVDDLARLAPSAAEDAPEAKDDERARVKKQSRHVRSVLIGPRERPFACTGFRISSDGATWVIGLSAPLAGQATATHGCVLTLPADGKAVRVTGP